MLDDSGGNTCLICPSSERVRRTATRKSWRNSVSRLARRPGSLATRMPSSARWICRAPTSARTAGASVERGDDTSHRSGAPSWRSITPTGPSGQDSNARATLDHRHEPLVYAFVSAQAGQRDHRGQRSPSVARPSATGPGPLAIRRRATVFPDRRGSRAATRAPLRRPARAAAARQSPVPAPAEADHREDPRRSSPAGSAGSASVASAGGLPRHRGGAVDAGSRQTGSRSSDAAVERVQHGEPVPGDRMMPRGQERLQASRDRLRSIPRPGRRTRILGAVDVAGVHGVRRRSGVQFDVAFEAWTNCCSSSRRRAAASGIRIQRRRRSLSSSQCSSTSVTRIT